MPGHLARGSRVADRYRLEAELGRGSAGVVWRAIDERLERQVALSLFDSTFDRDHLRERAGRAAALTHPRVVRIFDTGFDGGQFFMVRELVPGALGWAGLPMTPAESVEIGRQVAEAIHYAHERGVTHGGLGLGNVLLSEQGVKVSDFGLSAAALTDEQPAPTDDLRALGELLYAVSTGREHGAPTDAHSRPLADNPRGFAPVVLGLLDGSYDDASRVVADLDRLQPEPTEQRRRPVALLVAVGVVLVALAAFGITRLGERAPQTPRGGQASPITGDAFAVATVADFDPMGDGREGRSTVAKIADGDPQTFWSTERYRDSPDFGGLGKSGVGVILDLGSEQVVGQAQVRFVTEGCSYELRYSPTRDRDVENWDSVAAVKAAPTRSVLEFPATPSRWWLVWVTELTRGVAGAGSGYACGIAEAELYEP